MTSTSPFRREAIRGAASGTDRKIIRSKSDLPAQWSGFASNTALSSLTHETNRTGPVPMGFWLKVSTPTLSRYFFGTIWPP